MVRKVKWRALHLSGPVLAGEITQHAKARSSTPCPAGGRARCCSEETWLTPPGTERSIWQGMEEDLNFALKRGLYLSVDMLLFVIHDIKEILVVFVFHLISCKNFTWVFHYKYKIVLH